MQRSEQIQELATALAKSQGSYPHLERTRTVKVVTKAGGGYTYDYATLADVQACIRGPWSENGLAYWQTVANVQGGVEITLMVSHSSGQFVETPPLFIPCGQDPQSIGGGITYGLRYQLSAFAGIASEYDDDASAAQGHEATTDARPARSSLPACPDCGKSDGVIIGKPVYGGGFVCFKAKGGCGHKWQSAEEKPAAAPPATQKPPNHDAEVAALLVALDKVTDQAGYDVSKAEGTRLWGVIDEPSRKIITAKFESAKSRIATATAPNEPTKFHEYHSRVAAAVATETLMNEIRGEIASSVASGELTPDEARHINEAIDEKLKAKESC